MNSGIFSFRITKGIASVRRPIFAKVDGTTIIGVVKPKPIGLQPGY